MEHLRQFGEFITQTLAFIIFFWVMKAYAWPPLLRVLEDRRKAIDADFAGIARKQSDADKLHKEYEARMRNIEQEARTKIQESVAEGRRVAAEIVENARTEAQKAADAAQRNIQIEVAKARVGLREEIIDMTLAASERLMRERLGEEAGQRGQVAKFLADLEAGNN
jgi:F-type H+-transporting ATPase subunit b